MNPSAVPIGTLQLSLTVVLVVAAGAISALLRLGLLRSLLWGTVRSVVQLLLIGLVLLLGVFATGWFASRILDNMRSGAADNQASSQANVEQIARSVEPATPPVESAPAAVAPKKTPPAPVKIAPPAEAAPAPARKVVAASVAEPTFI